jgi:hypothetical protein
LDAITNLGSIVCFLDMVLVEIVGRVAKLRKAIVGTQHSAEVKRE